jgi:urea transporter
MTKELPLFLSRILKGVSQIMLQENNATALLFIAGLAAGSIHCAAAVVAGAAIGAATASLLKYNHQETDSGLYGFSAALVGAALAFMYESSVALWIFIAFGSILAAIVQHFFIARNIPAFTFPFILVTWIIVPIANNIAGLIPSANSQLVMDYGSMGLLLSVSNGFGEVIFQGAALSGVLFLIGVMVSNPIAGIYAIAASWVGALIALWTGQPAESVSMGLFGFNAVLTAIVFAGNTKSDALWTLIAVVLSIAIHLLLANSGILNFVGGVLTFPFVLATWIIIASKKVAAALSPSGTKS